MKKSKFQNQKTIRQKTIWVGMLFLAPLLWIEGQSAIASENLPSEEEFFADIPRIASAARLEKSVFELGASVTIIDREMIEASTAVEIPDLLRLVPGFQVTYVNGTQFAATYHGASDQWPRRMEIMVDGRSVYLNTLSAVEWSALGITLEDIERIEVVRGPNAPTFGSNSLNGSINIVTRAPFMMTGKYLRGTFGSQKTGNVVAQWGGNLGDWDAALTAQYRSDDGFDHVNDNKRVTDLRFRGDRQFGAVDNVSIQLGLTDGTTGADGKPNFPDNITDPFRDRDIRSDYQQLTWDRAEPEGSRYRLNLYRHEFEDDDSFDLSAATVKLLTGFDLPPGVTVPLGLKVTKTKRLDMEFQHDLAPRDSWRLAWGFGVRYDELSSKNVLAGQQVEKISGRLFGSFEWKPIDEVTLSVDALTETHESYGTETSPRIALNWLAAKNRSFRISASRSYRVYSLLERFLNFPATASNGVVLPIPPLYGSDIHDNFVPEQMTAYELGYTESWDDLGLFLDMRLFREEMEHTGWSDRINGTFYLIDDGGSYATNGIDMQLDFRPTRDTRLVGAYSYADINGTVYDEATDIPPTKITGFFSMEHTVPRTTLSLLLSHQFTPQWKGSLTLYHMGSVEWLGDGARVDAYNRLDLKVMRDLHLGDGKGQIALVIQNLTDNEYNEFRNPGNTDRLGNVFERRAYLQMRVKFN